MKRALRVAVCLIALWYARTPVYRFPSPAVFAGPEFYNPYAGVTGAWSGALWQRVNLHTHSRAWYGLTSGRQSDAEVARVYRDLGYAVPGVSNYHHIATPEDGSDVLIYEHGYNIGKLHQLAIGARRVTWFDFPLIQFASQKQLIIDLMKNNADLVGLAHPNGRIAYTLGDMRRLTGYQLIEVANGPLIERERWDEALSAGRVVWGMSNDDSHDTNDKSRLARAWNMVAAPTASAPDIISALREGHFYSMMRFDETKAEPTAIETVDFKDGTLSITCSGSIATFEFFGQDGVVRKSVGDARSASYTFDASDTYIRTIIWSPRFVMFLNPILRWDGRQLPAPVATVNVPATWMARTLLVGVAVLCLARVPRAGRKSGVPASKRTSA